MVSRKAKLLAKRLWKYRKRRKQVVKALRIAQLLKRELLPTEEERLERQLLRFEKLRKKQALRERVKEEKKQLQKGIVRELDIPQY